MFDEVSQIPCRMPEERVLLVSAVLVYETGDVPDHIALQLVDEDLARLMAEHGSSVRLLEAACVLIDDGEAP